MVAQLLHGYLDNDRPDGNAGGIALEITSDFNAIGVFIALQYHTSKLAHNGEARLFDLSALKRRMKQG